MPTLPLVPDLDELEDRATRLRSRREEAVDEELLGQRGEETLDNGSLSQQLPMRLMPGVKPAVASSC